MIFPEAPPHADCTVDATGSHERPLHVQSVPKVEPVCLEERPNWHTPIAELRVGRDEKNVGRKKLTRFSVYSIRLGAIVLELFAVAGTPRGRVSGRCEWGLYQRTLRESVAGVGSVGSSTHSEYHLPWPISRRRNYARRSPVSEDIARCRQFRRWILTESSCARA